MEKVAGVFDPRHFSVVLGRIAHIAIGKHQKTLCGRELGRHPRIEDLTATEAQERAACKTCKMVVKP